MKILIAFWLLFAMNASAAEVVMKVECNVCESDSQFIDKATRQTNKNGIYNVYISNFRLGIIKKVRYIKSVTYDKIGDPIDRTKVYIVPAESKFIESMNTYHAYNRRASFYLSEQQVPEYIAPSAYDIIVNTSNRNIMEAYYSQNNTLLEMLSSLTLTYFVLTDTKPSVELVFSDKSRAIFKVDDVSLPSMRLTLKLQRAIDKFGNSLPISPSSYNDLGLLSYPTATEPDIDKLLNIAITHGLTVVDVRPTNHSGGGTGGNGGGKTICYKVTMSGAANSSSVKCMTI